MGEKRKNHGPGAAQAAMTSEWAEIGRYWNMKNPLGAHGALVRLFNTGDLQDSEIPLFKNIVENERTYCDSVWPKLGRRRNGGMRPTPVVWPNAILRRLGLLK